ncbi:RNA polymerase sigma factor [Salinifilum ghardaiensis]
MAGPHGAASASGSDPEADGWLVAKIRGGDVQAYEALVRRHRDRTYRIALRMLGNPHDADDVAQEVVIQLWTAIASFAETARFITWLYRVVINRCLNHQRRHRPAQPLVESDPPAVTGAEESAIAAQRARATMAAVAALPDEQRAALVLHQLEGLSYREVAAVLPDPDTPTRSTL